METRYLSFVMEIGPGNNRKIFLLRRDGVAVPVAEDFFHGSPAEFIWDITERHWLEAQGFLLQQSK